MMYVAKKEKRILNPVLLQIDLKALFKPGVMYADCNATRRDASLSDRPTQIRFDLVKQRTHFDVPTDLRKYYQAEVLVPSPISEDYIIFPTKINPFPSIFFFFFKQDN